jgi:hypothetical protein
VGIDGGRWPAAVAAATWGSGEEGAGSDKTYPGRCTGVLGS